MEAKTIPVMVDSRKNVGHFEMTRAAYFYIEAIEPSTDIPMGQSSFGMPALPLEFSGVLYKPAGKAGIFETPDHIEALFETVERHESLYVDSDNIWVPNVLFDRTPRRGDVFRVPFPLFVELYSHCRDDATLDPDIPSFGGAGGTVVFSATETVAYAQWSRMIVEEAKSVYPKNADLKLGWKE